MIFIITAGGKIGGGADPKTTTKSLVFLNINVIWWKPYHLDCGDMTHLTQCESVAKLDSTKCTCVLKLRNFLNVTGHCTPAARPRQSEPEFLNFKGPHKSIPRNQCLVRNQFRRGIDSWRYRFNVKEELKISELSSSYVVCGGKDTPIGQHIFNTQNNMAAVGRGWKINSCLKN